MNARRASLIPSVAATRALVPWLACVSLQAAPVSLDRAVVSAGGGTTASGRFSVQGTIGQPVAFTGPSSGVNLASRAGFWSQIQRWINAVPSATPDIVPRRSGQGTHVLVSQLLANDADGDWDRLTLRSYATVSSGGGLVQRDGPWIIYLPPAGGGAPTDTFTYEIADGLGGTSTGTVTVQVAAPPVTGAGPLAIRSLVGPPALVEVRFQGIAGRTYRVQTAASAAGPWSNAGNFVADATGRLLFTEAPQPQPRFFRVIEP